MPGKGISENCDRCCTKTGGILLELPDGSSAGLLHADKARFAVCARFFRDREPPRRVDWQMQTCADGSGGPVGLAVL